jgi:hypothetical protein
MKRSTFWNKFFANLPPIDFALLAHEKRGYRHTPATIKKFTASNKRSLKEKRKVRAALRPPIKPVRQRLDLNSVEVLLRSIEIGHWYGRSDMQSLSGLKRGTVATAILRAEKQGYMTRTRNPEWVRQGGAECEFLYRKLKDFDALVSSHQPSEDEWETERAPQPLRI